MNNIVRLFFVLAGFAYGGLLGAIAGFFVGDFVTIILTRLANAGIGYVGGQGTHVKQLQNIFFTSTFLVMGHIAKSAGRVSEEDIRAARFVMQRMGLNESQRQTAIQLFNKGKQADFNLETTLTQLIRACSNNKVLLRMFIEIQYQAASATANQNNKKTAILEFICRRLGYNPYQFNFYANYYRPDDFVYAHQYNQSQGQNSYQQHRTQYDSEYQEQANYQRQHRGNDYQYYYGGYKRQDNKSEILKKAYDLLGMNEKSSVSDIKKSYRKMMSHNHPDKLVSKGLPEEMIKLATEKTQNIQKAYEAIREARGF